MVYAGHGHFSRRLSPSIWENPFRVGKDGNHIDTVLKFLAQCYSLGLDSCLPELTGKRIACDCSPEHLCHVDIIIAKWMETALSSQRRYDTSWRSPGRRAVVAGVRVVHAVPQAFSQFAAMLAIRSLFPNRFSTCEMAAS